LGDKGKRSTPKLLTLQLITTTMTHEELAKEFLQLMEHVEGCKNYEPTNIIIDIRLYGVAVETIHVNEYGGKYSNEDNQYIPFCCLSNDAMEFVKTCYSKGEHIINIKL